MVRDYELMYIVRPELDDEALRTATESVDTLIRGLGGTVGKTTMWGKRRLAYEVARLRDGHYVITLLQLDGARVTDLERALQIHDTVFRHLLVRGELFRRIREQTVIILDLLQGGEPLRPVLRPALLQGVEQDARGLRGSPQADVLDIGVKDKGDIVRQVHPFPIHRADQLHEVIEKPVQRRSLQGVGKGYVVALRVEA